MADLAREQALGAAPRKRVAVEAMVCDTQGRWLIVQQTYKKDGWSLVGGIVEQFESVAAALRRESTEEIGIALQPARLLVTDHRTDRNFSQPQHESIQFVMAAQPLSASDVARITLQREEISSHRFVSPQEAGTLLRPRVFERASAAWQVLMGNDSYNYLENGKPVFARSLGL